MNGRIRKPTHLRRKRSHLPRLPKAWRTSVVHLEIGGNDPSIAASSCCSPSMSAYSMGDARHVSQSYMKEEPQARALTRATFKCLNDRIKRAVVGLRRTLDFSTIALHRALDARFCEEVTWRELRAPQYPPFQSTWGIEHSRFAPIDLHLSQTRPKKEIPRAWHSTCDAPATK